jgi:hypothetical protein
MVASIIATVVDKHSLYHRMKDQYIHDLLKEESAENKTEPMKHDISK